MTKFGIENSNNEEDEVDMIQNNMIYIKEFKIV